MCHNPSIHDLEGGYLVDVDEVIDSELRLQRGITLSRGDPFLQPVPLKKIAAAAKEHNLDVWCYTGFLYTWLTDERNPHYNDNIGLLEYIDVLIDGRFLVEKKDFRLNLGVHLISKLLMYKEV